jgi:4-hydroxy-tetrahydrodipicolinate synthase
MDRDKAFVGLSGVGTALVTPFREDGSVDVDALERLVVSNIQAGVNFLCVLGTTAETPTLTDEEQHLIRETIVRIVGRQRPLLLGFGGNDTAGMLRRMKADAFNGMDALLIVTPYYNKPSQEGMYRHYRTLSEASPLPIVLYNVPSRTGVNLTADTTLRLARDCHNIIGIKEASGNVEQITRIIRERPEGFKVLSGDDKLTPQLMSLGADGVVSVLSNLFPRMVCDVVNGSIFNLQSSIFAEWCDLLFAEGSPAGVKAALNLKGICNDVLRLPLVPVSAELKAKMKQLL